MMNHQFHEKPLYLQQHGWEQVDDGIWIDTSGIYRHECHTDLAYIVQYSRQLAPWYIKLIMELKRWYHKLIKF